jgi:hypothetical protein
LAFLDTGSYLNRDHLVLLIIPFDRCQSGQVGRYIYYPELLSVVLSMRKAL